MTKPILIDLGCGRKKYQDPTHKTFGIDLWLKSDADLYAEGLHLPVRDATVKRIYSRHFFEHFAYNDIVALFGECYRILQDNGELEIIVPHYSCVTAFVDPTHRMFFTKRTFDKFTPFGFRPVEFRFYWSGQHYGGRFPLVNRMVNWFANKFVSLERFFALIGGIYEVRCVLKKDPNLMDPEHRDGSRILGL